MTPSADLWAGDAAHRGGRPPRRRLRRAPPEPPPSPPPPQRPRWVAALAAAVVAVTALAVAVAVLGGDEGEDPLPPLPGANAQGDVGRVYAAAGRAVASVRVREGGAIAAGTGFVVDDGLVITNAHVVDDADTATVRFGDRGRELAADVRGVDESTDLALLDLSGVAGLPRPLRLADSDAVAVGDEVVAIGHPFGLDRTATAGIVSGLRREIRAPNGFRIDEVIQTDAAINPGNSGGPLLDMTGAVIGVNSQIATAGAGGNVGIGFAVPSNTLRDVMLRLRAGQGRRGP